MISIVNTECHVPKTFSDLAKIAAWGRLGLAGAALLVRQQAAAARCASDAACTSRVTRLITLAGLLIGAILLWLGYVYV